MGYRTRRQLVDILVHTLLIIIVIFSMFPIIWMCMIALKGAGESVSGFNSLILKNPSLGNLKRLFELLPNFWKNFYNSVFTTFFGTVTSLFFCSLAGFAFAKYKFPGNKTLFYFCVATMLIPPEVGSIPMFLVMRKMELINSLWSLVIPRMATAIGIFYMRQYIMDVPDEIIESARIDGCHDFKIYTSIVMPIIKPALPSWGILTVIARWNDFFWPLIFLRKSEKYTLMVAITMLPFSEGMSTPWPVTMAGTALATLPVIIIFIVLQAFMKDGLTLGAVKG